MAARYGIPEIENRPVPKMNYGTVMPTGGRNLSDLWAALRAEEEYGRGFQARAAMAQRRQQALMGEQMRRGVQAPGRMAGAQTAAGIQPQRTATNPLLESLAAHVLQGSMTKANLDLMRQILAARKPSGLQQGLGYALPVAGAAVGGAAGGPAGASVGMGLGQGLGGLFTSY